MELEAAMSESKGIKGALLRALDEFVGMSDDGHLGEV